MSLVADGILLKNLKTQYPEFGKNDLTYREIYAFCTGRYEKISDICYFKWEDIEGIWEDQDGNPMDRDYWEYWFPADQFNFFV